MSRYNRWRRRAYIRITNPVAVAGFQHRINLTWAAGMRSDFRDIRFTQKDGKRCYFWIESYVAKTSAIVWVKIPDASQATLFMFYDNNGASTGSDGVNTFELFDDFLGATFDANIWTSIAGSGVAVTGSVMTATAASGTSYGVQSISTFGSYAVRARIKPGHTCGSSYLEGWRPRHIDDTHQVTAYYSHIGGAPNVNAYYLANGGSTSTAMGATCTQWNVQECKLGSSSAVWTINDGSPATLSTNFPTSAGRLLLFAYATGSVFNCDWIFVRKYAATDPTLAIVFRGINPRRSRAAIRNEASGAYTGHEYVFDPENVDHGMVAGVGAEEIEMTNNVDHSMVGGVGIVEYDLGAINIFHPIYPTATWNLVLQPLTDLPDLISVTVHHGMDDAMAQADFEYDGYAVGNYFSGDYMKKVVVKIPDYTGTLNAVFVGIVPSSKARYVPAKDKMSMMAVDYGLFLTKNPLEIKDLSLLPPADQTSEGSNVAKELDYDTATHYFQIGNRVTGSVSGASGTIAALVQGDGFRRMTLYPATGKFVDDEPLMVGAVQYALADGRSVDIPYTPYYQTIGPQDWFRAVLGGDNWMRVTGIEPYKIIPCAWTATSTPPAVPFIFGSEEKIFDAIQRFAKYIRYITTVKLRDAGGGNYVPAFYAVPLTSIDDPSDGLDLPAAATITGPNDPFLAGDIELEQNGENQVDRVRVTCQDPQGKWLESIWTNSRADYGEGPIRTFQPPPVKDICTQTDLNAYRDDMVNLYSARAATWHAILYDRSDLQKYQLLTISGYTVKIPDGTYRIIKIAYECGCAVNKVHIWFISTAAFSTLVRRGMTYTDSITEIQRIVDKAVDRIEKTELGSCTANNGWLVNFTTEAGVVGQGRDSTSTPDTAGVIPIGAKISIHYTKGGIVCIPIVAASGSSTDLLVVDVPTGVTAPVDPDDANYWFLSWTPGTNNQLVSVNYQTTGYPSAHGIVLPYGNPASCRTAEYDVRTTRLRIRFSGPSTTYYIKLWGVRNGVYSATGATATITSGAGVTVADPEEPEPIGVINQFLCAGAGLEYAPPATQTLYDADLPFQYNGWDNIYLGGPVDDFRSDEEKTIWPVGDYLPRKLIIDDWWTITGPGGVIEHDGRNPTNVMHNPINIRSILVVGTNHLKIELKQKVPPWGGCGPVWIRTYYL